MRLIILTLICIYSSLTISAQVINDKEHAKIVKEPPRIKMPEIVSADFCQRLHLITIPDSISFRDIEGVASSYYITFRIVFDKYSNVLSVKPGGTIKNIPDITEQLKQLLKTTKWKVKTTKKKLEIIFECSLAEKEIKNIILATTNNFQRKNICK